MPKWGYSITEEELDPEKTVKASGREARVSPKHAREICRTIKGMMLTQAKQYLTDVSKKKKPVPFTRYIKKLGHHHGMRKSFVGKYPVKAAAHVLKVIEGAEANAENKGLDTDRMRIIYAVANRGIKLKRFTSRAQGRSSPSIETLTHIEVVLEERPETGGET